MTSGGGGRLGRTWQQRMSAVQARQHMLALTCIQSACSCRDSSRNMRAAMPGRLGSREFRNFMRSVPLSMGTNTRVSSSNMQHRLTSAEHRGHLCVTCSPAHTGRRCTQTCRVEERCAGGDGAGGAPEKQHRGCDRSVCADHTWRSMSSRRGHSYSIQALLATVTQPITTTTPTQVNAANQRLFVASSDGYRRFKFIESAGPHLSPVGCQ